MEQALFDHIADLPHLLWDTAFPTEELTENKPYRNAGDLLVKRCPTNREALRLCGCDAAVLDGTASDYECFSALCMATPILTGHRSAALTNELLHAVFGLETELSPYQTEELWEVLNQAIEDTALRPSDVAVALNIESICYRIPALSPLPQTTWEGVDLYPVFDWGDPIITLLDPSFGSKGLAQTAVTLGERLPPFLHAGCVSVHLQLPKYYTFLRNSRKKEVDDILLKGRQGNALTIEDKNVLATAFAVILAQALTEHRLTLLLTTDADEEELIRLYDYLALNQITPHTVLLSHTPERYASWFCRHTVRTEKGLPSLLPTTDRLRHYAAHFPLGCAILPCRNVIDTVSLAACLWQRRQLVEDLAAISSDADILLSLAEDIVYGNIKNRFGI